MCGILRASNSIIKVCDAEVFDVLITDWDAEEEQLLALEKAGVNVITVEKAL